ncbi:UNVERIFIED_CONTAM: hypothetical protein FKN15_008319 [Acipenser sinensis]
MAAQDELNQLERVFLRLGHAETDEQLQHIISKFLPPVLLKLSSIQEGVRKKVMELLVHLNKRIKSRPKIQLPVETLLVQYQDPAAASFVTNFTIIYIKMGYPRLDVEEQCELAPTLLTAMEGKPQPQQDSLMHLLIPTLFSMKYPSEPSKVASPFILVEKPKTVHLLLDFMLDVLMMPYGFVLNEPQSRPNPASPQSSAGNGSAGGVGIPQPPPGMSFYAAKRIIGETPWTPEQLEQCKLGIVKFIKAEQVPEVEAVVHLVIASSDTRHSVATAADLELKSKQSIIDWNNPLIINKIYKVYLGDIPLKTKECKLGIVKFIKAEQVPEVEAVVHLVIASSDTRHSVATAADLELKSKQSIIDWNNPLIINKIYKVYLGDIPLKTKEGAALKPELKREPGAALKPELKREPASQRMETPAKYTVGTSTLPFNPSAFGEIILYLRMCLAHSAGAMPTSQSLADMQDNSPAIASYVRNLLSGNHNSLLVPKGGDSNPVQLYMELLQQLLSAIGGVPVMYCLLEVVSVYPQKLAAKFTDTIDWIKGLMNTNKEDMQELAAQLYAVVVSTMSGNDLKTAVQNLVKITKDNHAKQLELQFTVGEAITSAAIGTGSVASRDVWTCTEEEYTPPAEVKVNDVVPWVLNMILNKYIISQNPHVRQASCIWLLSLVKKLSQHKEIKVRLHIKQHYKVKVNDVVPWVLNMILNKYIISQNPHVRQASCIWLLSLVKKLSQHKEIKVRVKHGVSEDTEVFQGGSLGKTPDGQSLSTYKELCALASDLNQPDLVYKFMNLANHHAMWNSRKGAAFGFNMIAAKAGEQLTPYLSQLVPRLYRYQFDPNLGIRQAMTSIWDALVTDKKCVDRYLKEILQDVISNLTNNMWRVRESSCLALNDLIRGRQLDDIIDQLPEIWETLFRVRDDIKESVRKAADLTLKSLSKVCVRMCEPSSAAAQRTVAVLLPCLLEKGIMSNVSEVRALSIQTLVKISKSAGARLKPHAPRLIPALLESLTVLEPQVLNYLSLRATEQEKTAMDGARLSAAKSSPMMETINMCLQHLDASVLGQLVPRLCDLLKGAVGLGTKGACASVIVSLTVQCPQDLTPYSGKLMSALVNGLNDRSSVVQKSFAFALGHVVRTAKDSSVEKLLTKLGTWYLEKEDVLQATQEDRFQELVGILIPLINKNSPTSAHTRKSKEDDDDDLDEKEKELQTESLLCAFESLGKAWPKSPATQSQYRLQLCQLMCERLKLSTWRVQVGVLQSMKAYFQGLLLLDKDHTDSVELSEILTKTCDAITFPLENKSYSSVRTEALNIVELLIRKIDECHQWGSLTPDSRNQLINSLTTMESDSRPELGEKSTELRKRLQNLS